MNNIKKTLLVCLSVLSLNSFADTPTKVNSCYLTQNSIRFSQPATSVHGALQDNSFYEDFRGVCLESLSELNVQLKMAFDEWKYGNHNSAVMRLHNALKDSANKVAFDSIDVPPHTATSIINSYRISEKVKDSIQKNLPDRRLGLQVEFMMLTELINIVNWANTNLDNPYYRNVVDTYISFGNNFSSMNYFNDYLGKVKQLSIKYLRSYQKVKEALASNKVELDVAHSFASAAKETLQQSVYRRQFCAGLNGLDHIMRLTESFQCGQAQIPSYRQVNIVRSTMSKVEREISVVRVGRSSCY
ncbi:hypothetical protein [Halobacteriovorax sp.]|uniref:hypothetical protein n=1 Tax=Halobacteriovorax sp. TaxID=2020862 RepID=UPI003566331B